MKTKKIFHAGITGICMMLTMSVTVSCLDSDEKTITIETPTTGIPDDSEASPNPQIDYATTNIPNIQTTMEDINGVPVIRIDMTGVKNPNEAAWLRLVGTGYDDQNVWVEVDDMPKGILVYNNSDDNITNIMTDIVFTVDNSGSMSEEADAIARDIVSWAEQLSSSGINPKFGVVGYEGPITGAMRN